MENSNWGFEGQGVIRGWGWVLLRLSFTERDLGKEVCAAKILHVLRLDYLAHKGEKGMRAGEVGSQKRVAWRPGLACGSESTLRCSMECDVQGPKWMWRPH